jgi:hypothetical protein
MSGPPDSKPVSPGGFDPNFINSMLPDGTLLRFPKGTDPKIIDQVYREQLSKGQPQQAPKPQSPPQIGTGEAAAIGGTQGLTFNFGDEIASGIAATVGRPLTWDPIKGENWSERYDNALDEARGKQGAAQEQHPVAFGAGEFAGAALPAVVAPQMYGANWVARAPTMAAAAGRGAAVGAGLGALTGFGAGEGGARDRAASSAIGGATGGAIGAVAAPVSRVIGNAVAGRAPNPAVPTNDQLRVAGTAAYDAADNAGVIITPQAIRTFQADLQNQLGQAGLDQTLHPRIVAAFRRIQQQADSGQPITLRGLDILRQVAADAADSPSRGERRLGSLVIERLDDMIDNLAPGDLIQGDANAAVPALQQARQIWSSLRKSETIDELIHNAELQAASTNSGGNLQNTIRQKLRTLLTNRTLSRGFTAEEREALEELVRGTPTQNALRTLGRLAPSSNSWLGVLSTLAGGPAGLAVPVVGAAAKGLANRSTGNTVQGLSELVRAGAGVQAPPGAGPAQGAIPLIARALMGGQAGAINLGQAYGNALSQPPTTGPR